MIFSSPIFLFFFLPLVLTVYCLLPGLRARNLWLLGASILFYGWGEPAFLLLMLGSSVLNCALGLWVEEAASPPARRAVIVVAVAVNLGLLAYFKYANFAVDNLNALLHLAGLQPISPEPVHLPIGISFFTFHALSYVLDIYDGKTKASRKLSETALYIFLFPQLIAGPILRWGWMAPQIASRHLTSERFAEGVRRFGYGLGKKVLIANALAAPADQVFSLSPGAISPMLAWIGILCYTLQIYFDFSGYSDMAIGIGKMLGFEFIENFNYPYISQSIREFWRRWHISLSNWFRDYVYFRLGGNRCSKARNYFNLILVFLMCGLWHGASWTFVVWGLYHGAFLVLERTRFGAWLQSLPRLVRHSYALLVIVIGWLIFRSENLPQALVFLRALFGFAHVSTSSNMLYMVLTNQATAVMCAGVVFSIPITARLREKMLRTPLARVRLGAQWLRLLAEPLWLAALLVLSAAWLADGTYNPFLYFRF